LVLCMDGRHLYTTNMVWSERFRVVGMVYHLQVLFCFLLLLIYLLLRFL
jgi:ABC-type multidrug transport system permease subunit